MRTLGTWLLRLSSARQAILDGANLDRFRQPMDRKLRIGLALLALGLLTGWPLVALLGILALWLSSPLTIAIGGPTAYAISWVIYGAGLLVAGMGSVVYLRDLNRWLLRRLTEALLGGPTLARQAAERATIRATERIEKGAVQKTCHGPPDT